MQVEAEVLKLHCSECGSAFPTVQFSGDTDMATSSLASATAFSSDELVIGEMAANELHMGYEAALDAFADRITRDQSTKFKAVHLIPPSVIPVLTKPSDFAEFRRSYKTPELTFRCIGCGGRALVVDREIRAEFERHGGKVTVLGDLTLF